MSRREGGGDFVGVNPLHALFTADPERCSPFSPSNRSVLNPLYIALDHIPGIAVPFAGEDVARARLQASDKVDYQGVAALKLGRLRTHWRRIHEEPRRCKEAAPESFERFVEEGGAALRDHALFEALSHHMVAQGHSAGWQGWPEAYRSPNSAAVQRFAAEQADEVRFHLWLQWLADVQLQAAAERARAAGMRIGLYLDLAVGAAPDGSATWSDPELVVPGANIGAPPDAFFAGGQNWGLAPLSPAALRARQLAPYRRVLGRTTRHAGAIRLDHAMGLHRLFWIPHGMTAKQGCYVLYPLADMLQALADISAAQRAIVVGEDLGTVPKGFRELMQSVNMLSYRVLYFEWVRGSLRAAASYRRNAFVTASTHDLPPLASWWAGADIALFRELGLLDSATAEQRRQQRAHDRRALITRLRRDLPGRSLPASLKADSADEKRGLTQDVAVAIQAFLARTPSWLLGLQFEDLCGAEAPVNIPGTWKEYPNWQLRAPASIEEAVESALWTASIQAVTNERPRSG
ncbi:MAG: 4-alpha-glucanotransferase [Kiloniellales bacterium]